MHILHLAPIDWLLVALYGAGLLVLAFRRTRRSGGAEEYLLGGRLLTLPGFVAALVSTWYGGILGVGEFSYQYGLANWMVFGVPYYVFALVFAWTMAGRVRASGVVSIPDMLSRSAGRGAGVFGAIMVWFVSSPAPYFLMLGVLVQVVTGWPAWICLTLGGVLTVASTVHGGMQSVVRTDLLQFVLMFGGFFLLLGFLIPAHGTGEFLAARVPPELLTLTGGNDWQYIVVWFFIAMWTLVAPQFHQFTASAASPRVARRGIVLSVLCWLVFDAVTTLSGLYARALLPELADASMAYPLLAEAVLPPVAKGIFFLGMLATVVSTTEGLTFIGAATLGRDVLAVLLRREEDAMVERLTRWSVVATAALSIGFALAVPSVVTLWYVIGTLFIPALLLPVLAATWPRLRIGARATIAAMACGFCGAMLSFVWGAVHAVGGAPSYPFGIEPMYVGLSATVLIYAWEAMRSRSGPAG